jgi:hypothetical protein
LLATYGDDAVRIALTRGLEEQAIGAEYIAHYLATGVTMPSPIEGDATGQAATRSSFLGHPRGSFSRSEQLPLDLPSATAHPASRGGRVQTAAGARRAGAQRRAWTRPSTAPSSSADGGRS